MADFRKNISHRLISKENNSRTETPGGKNSFTEKNSFVAYNSKKNLAPVNVKNKKQKQNSYPKQIIRSQKRWVIQKKKTFFDGWRLNLRPFDGLAINPIETLLQCIFYTGLQRTSSCSGAWPNVNFRKISVRKTIWDLEFSEYLL